MTRSTLAPVLAAAALAACSGADLTTPPAPARDADPTTPLFHLVATGERHGCAVAYAGVVSCWGANDAGQLGNGTTTASVTPVLVIGLPLHPIVAISAGRRHTCAIDFTGGLWCWGANGRGQLGIGSTVAFRAMPQRVTSYPFSEVAAGGEHTCAIRPDGTADKGGDLFCWGRGDRGQTGRTGPDSRLPQRVSAAREAITIGAGDLHSCAVLHDVVLSCWGDNTGQQLGHGGLGFSSYVEEVYTSDGFLSVDGGGLHTCGVLEPGGGACWGEGGSGQLGTGGTGGFMIPQPINAPLQEIRVGRAHSCGLLDTGEISCWGENAHGQLGTGDTAQRLSGGSFVYGGGQYRALDAGDSHTCAVTLVAGTVVCWGSNAYGQLGDGTYVSRSVPAPVAYPPPVFSASPVP